MRDPVCIRTYTTPFDAEVDRSLLRSEGIDAILSSDDAAGVIPGLWLATGGVKLLVTGAEAERAVAILSAHRSNEEGSEVRVDELAGRMLRPSWTESSGHSRPQTVQP